MGTMTESPSSLLRANSPRPGSPLTAGRVGSPAAAEEASVSYDKVIGLFTHSLSSELYDRHVAAIHRMCRAASEGFAIRELPKVDQIVQFTIALLRKTGAREVEEAATHLLRFARPLIYPQRYHGAPLWRAFCGGSIPSD